MDRRCADRGVRALIGAFIARERATADPLMDLRVLSRRPIW